MDESTLEVMAEIHGENLQDIIDSKTEYTASELREKLADHLEETGQEKRDRISMESFLDWYDNENRENFDSQTLKDHFQYLVEQGYAETTIKDYRYKGLKKFAELQLSAVSESEINELDQSKAIKTAFKQSDRDLDPDSRKGSGSRPITAEEKDKMIEAAPSSRTKICTTLLWQTGIRISELANLRVENIDLEEKEITVKTAKRRNHKRSVPFDLDLKFALEKYLNVERNKYGRASDYLLVSQRSEKPLPQNLSRTITNLAEKAGIQTYWTNQNGAKRAEISPHSFRKAYAIRLDKEGKSTKAIAERMGHSNTNSVDTYFDIS